jgi:hypothetical protein
MDALRHPHLGRAATGRRGLGLTEGGSAGVADGGLSYLDSVIALQTRAMTRTVSLPTTQRTLAMFSRKPVMVLLLCAIAGQLTWSCAQSGNSGALTGQDYAEIQQLYARYNFAIDAIDPDAVAALFTPDGTFSLGSTRQLVGREALANWVDTEVRSNHAIDHRRHWNTNLMITGTPEGAEAAVYLLTVNVGVNPPAILAAGRYEDTLVQTPQGWRFKTRMVQGDRDGQ